MLRLRLTSDERGAVQALRRDRSLSPAARDRVEMVCLADAGWGAPAIAAHLGYNPVTVRRLLKRFPVTGVAGLRRKMPGPPPDAARREQVEAALGTLLDRDRTWTAAQLATALGGEFGIALSPRQTRKYLSRIAAWRRTVRTLRHKQDPTKVERAKDVLTSLKKRPPLVGSGLSTSTSAASLSASR
jgi:putative transposase